MECKNAKCSVGIFGSVGKFGLFGKNLKTVRVLCRPDSIRDILIFDILLFFKSFFRGLAVVFVFFLQNVRYPLTWVSFFGLTAFSKLNYKPSVIHNYVN